MIQNYVWRVATSVGLSRAQRKVESLGRDVAIAEAIARRAPWWADDARRRAWEVRARLEFWAEVVSHLKRTGMRDGLSLFNVIPAEAGIHDTSTSGCGNLRGCRPPPA